MGPESWGAAAYLALASTAATVASTAYAYSESQKAAKRQESGAGEARQIAEANAVREEAETEERVRRLGEQQKQEEAMARARAGATGILPDFWSETGSFAEVLAFQREENVRQLGFEKKAGKSRADIVRRGGQYQESIGRAAADVTRAKGLGGIFSGVSKGIETYGIYRGGGFGK